MKAWFLPVHKNGQTLVEAVIAIAVAILIITGLVSLTTASIRNAQFSRNQALATKYAEEGIEKLRAFRDKHPWSEFTAGCNGYDAGSVPSPFTRIIGCLNVSPVDLNKRIATVTVSWTDAKGTHNSQLTSYFTNTTKW